MCTQCRARILLYANGDGLRLRASDLKPGSVHYAEVVEMQGTWVYLKLSFQSFWLFSILLHSDTGNLRYNVSRKPSPGTDYASINEINMQMAKPSTFAKPLRKESFQVNFP